VDVNRALSAGSDSDIRLWDLPTGETIRIYGDHTDAVRSAVRVGINRLASASFDNTLRLWELDSGKAIHILEMEHTPLTMTPLNAGRIAVGDEIGQIHIISL
jgi:WD40 repeat protein